MAYRSFQKLADFCQHLRPGIAVIELVIEPGEGQ